MNPHPSSNLLVEPRKANCYSRAVTTIKDIRRENLTLLLTEYRRDGKTQADFARALDVEPAYVSQLVTGVREIGDKTGRKVERVAGKPEGWMDRPQTLPARVGSDDKAPIPAVQVTEVADSDWRKVHPVATFSVPLLEIGASMGVGAVQPEYETIAGKLDLNPRWIRTHLPNASSPSNLRLITARGESMWDPEKGRGYQDGDLLFVDVGIVEVKVDAIYAFALNGELFIKLLQRLPDRTLKVISYNDKYPPYVLTEREDVRVIGRVVGGWNWRKL